MSGPDLRATIGRYVADLLNGPDPLLAAHDLLTPDFAFVGPGNRDGIHGADAFATFQDRMRGAFGDLVFTLDDAIVDADRAALVLTMRGRHNGPFLGVEPRGALFEIPLVDILRFRGGRISEITAYLDALDLRRRLETG